MIKYYTRISFEELKTHMRSVLQEGIKSPNVRRLAEFAISRKQEPIPAVFDFVRENFKYEPDPEGIELVIHPNRIAEDYFNGIKRAGDCDDHAILTASMLGSLGFQIRLMIVDANLSGEYNHVIAQAYRNNDWMWLDTTSINPIDSRPEVGAIEILEI